MPQSQYTSRAHSPLLISKETALSRCMLCLLENINSALLRRIGGTVPCRVSNESRVDFYSDLLHTRAFVVLKPKEGGAR